MDFKHSPNVVLLIIAIMAYIKKKVLLIHHRSFYLVKAAKIKVSI